MENSLREWLLEEGVCEGLIGVMESEDILSSNVLRSPNQHELTLLFGKGVKVANLVQLRLLRKNKRELSKGKV